MVSPTSCFDGLVEETKKSDALDKDSLRFARVRGFDLETRNNDYLAWQKDRDGMGLWPYFRRLDTALTPRATAVSELGVVTSGPNFGSQDYLSLSTHPAVHEAAAQALRDFGPLCGGSPALNGNTPLSVRLERELSEALGMEHVALFPTGWAAGFGAIRSLMHRGDHVLLDKLAHDSLRQGAAASGADVRFFAHLDNAEVRRLLAEIRAVDTKNAILVVTEGVFSMDSDTPDLAGLVSVCAEFGARLLVDAAHDFGAMGPGGGGQAALQSVADQVDFVVGAFSKSFATTGGFLATRAESVREFVRMFGGPQTFSSALTPIQTAVALAALGIIRSPEGQKLREAVAAVAGRLRDGLAAKGHRCMGDVVCPVVPVFIGVTPVARIASGLVARNGVIANLVEQPAVASDAARFRLQAMAAHAGEDVDQTVEVVDRCIREAWELHAGRGAQLASIDS